MSNKFKATIDKSFRSSDGTKHETREAHERHERGLLVDRVAGYVASDFDAAVLGDNVAVAADIILLASLMRPPRARRGNKPGESAAGPIGANSTEPPSETARSNGASDTGVAMRPLAEAPEARDGQGAAAPSEQPEAAGDPGAPVASVSGESGADPTQGNGSASISSPATLAASEQASAPTVAPAAHHRRGKAKEGAAA